MGRVDLRGRGTGLLGGVEVADPPRVESGEWYKGPSIEVAIAGTGST